MLSSHKNTNWELVIFTVAYPESKVEVLDLTHNNRLPFALQFDDPHWKQYLKSLKPLVSEDYAI